MPYAVAHENGTVPTISKLQFTFLLIPADIRALFSNKQSKKPLSVGSMHSVNAI